MRSPFISTAVLMLAAFACSRADDRTLFGESTSNGSSTAGVAGMDNTATNGDPNNTNGTGGSAPIGSDAGVMDGIAGAAGDNGSAGEGQGQAGTNNGNAGGGGDQGMAGRGDGGSAGEPEPEAECGNGVIEDGEECDGGADGADGCTNDCEVDCSDFGEGAIESSHHHCYNGFDEDNFAGAREDCHDRGGHLVTISNDEENDIAQDLTNNSKWIGAFEDVAITSSTMGDYEWVTGEPFGDYTNWDDEEPGRAGTRCGFSAQPRCYEHCAVILGDGTWDDRRCDMIDGYVCEWEPAGE